MNVVILPVAMMEALKGYISDLEDALLKVEELRSFALQELSDLSDIDNTIVKDVISSFQGARY